MVSGFPLNPNASPPVPRIITATALISGGGLFSTPRHISSDWEVSANHLFTDLVLQSYGDTVNLTSYSLDVSTLPSILYWRVRYNFEGGHTTQWSDVKVCFNGIWCDFEYGRPILLVEGAPDSVPKQGARLFGSPFAMPPGDTSTHIRTEWTVLEISDPNQLFGTNIWSYTAVGANGDGLYEATIPLALTAGQLYQFQVTYYYLDENGVEHATETVSVDGRVPQLADPTATFENEEYSTAVQSFIPTGPWIYGSNFDTTLGADTHEYSSWEIRDANTLSTVWASPNDSVNLTSIKVPDGTLQPATDYQIILCYYGKAETSGACVTRDFRTYEPAVIQQPTITTPDQPDGVHRLAEFTASPFTVTRPDNTPFPGGDIHLASRWILTNTDTNTLLIDYTTTDPAQLEFLSMADWEALGVVLEPGTNYEISVEYIGVLSTATGTLAFTTPLVDPITLTVEGAPNGVYKNPDLTVSPYNVSIGSDLALDVDWEVVNISNGTTVFSSLSQPANVLTVNVSNDLIQGTIYKFEYRIRFRSGFDKVVSVNAQTPILLDPTFTVQGEPQDVPPEPVISSSNLITAQGTVDTLSTITWRITDLNNNTVWADLNIPAPPLQRQAVDPNDGVVVEPSLDYIVSIQQTGVSGFTTNVVSKQIRGTTPVVDAPVITANCLPDNVDVEAAFAASPYTSTVPAVNTFFKTRWEIFETNGNGVIPQGATPLFTYESTAQPHVYDMAAAGHTLEYNKEYAITAKHFGQYTDSPVTTVVFTTVQLTAETLTITYPADGANLDLPFTDIILSDNGGNPVVTNLFNHTATDWQVVETSTGTVVWESLNDAVNLTSISLPDGALQSNVDYTIRARIYMDGCPSGWTEIPYTLPVIQAPTVNSIGSRIVDENSNTSLDMVLSPFTVLQGTDSYDHLEIRVVDTDTNTDLGVLAADYESTDPNTGEITVGLTLPNFDTNYELYITYFGTSGSYSAPETVQPFTTPVQYTLPPLTISVTGAPDSVPTGPTIDAQTPPIVPAGAYTIVSKELTVENNYLDLQGIQCVLTSNVDYVYNPGSDWANISLPDGTLSHSGSGAIGACASYNAPRSDFIVTATSEHATRTNTALYYIVDVLTPTLNVVGGNTDVPLDQDVVVNGSNFTKRPSTVGTETHVGTTWEVRDSNNNLVHSLTGTSANGSLTSLTIPVNLLTLSETYTVTAVYNAQYQSSDPGTVTFSTQALPSFSAPNLTVNDNGGNVSDTPVLTISPITIVPGGSDSHVSTTWTVYASDGVTVVYTATTSGTELLTHTIPAGNLVNGNQYFFSAVANGNLNSSAEAVIGLYTVGSIDTPTIGVEGSPNNVPNDPVLTLSPFSGSGNFTSMDIEIRDTANPAAIYYSASSNTWTANYQVPAGFLPANTQMDFRVRYNNDQGAVSAWGSTTATTGNFPPTTAPTITVDGEPNAGGF